MTVIEFPAERDVLARHVIVGSGDVPRLELITGILREVGRSRRRCGAIDGRQQDEVAAGIVDLAAAQRECVTIFVEPPAVVEHEA